MSTASFLGWLGLGVFLLIAIGMAAVAFKRWSNGRHKAAAGLASLHPLGTAIAKAADIDLTREQVLIRYVEDCQHDGKIAAAKRWGDRIARKQADKSYAEIKDTFSDDEGVPAEEEAAEEEAEVPNPRPRRAKATS